MRRRLVRVLIWLLGIPLIAYLAVLGWMYANQRQLLYLPDRSRPQLGQLRQLGVREVSLRTTDGLDLLSWYLPPPGGRPVIAYFHGNGGHIGYRADRVERFARAGFGALMVEYRGYGRNPGIPTETGLFADAVAALAFLDHERVPAGARVLYGESLGSGIAVHLAAAHEIGALVLEAPYTSIAAVARYHYPFVPAGLLLWDRFDSLSRIGQTKAPVLILYGGRDRIVPARFSAALLTAAPEPKEGWFAPEGGHEDLARFGGLDAAIDFIERRLR